MSFSISSSLRALSDLSLRSSSASLESEILKPLCMSVINIYEYFNTHILI